MKCEYCEIISGKEPAEIIYQDDEVLAFVKEDAITPGQITVIPKENLLFLNYKEYILLYYHLFCDKYFRKY